MAMAYQGLDMVAQLGNDLAVKQQQLSLAQQLQQQQLALGQPTSASDMQQLAAIHQEIIGLKNS